MTKFSGYLAKTWLQWTLAFVLFFSFSFFYMGQALTNCSTTTTAFNTDSTGGLAWFQWAGGNDLTWGHTDKSNYPAGESIDRPQHITSQAFFIPYKIASTLTTPICGLNIMILVGYMSTALLMFGLIKWLFDRAAIAIFAGYAAAFVPFHQFKAQSHIVYASAAIFIAIIWVYLWLIQQPSYKRVSLLALVSALGFYTDGYFILLTALLVGGIFFFGLFQQLVLSPWRKKPGEAITNWPKYLRSQIRYLAWFGGLLFVLILPIVYTQLKYGSQISESLAAARSPIRSELKNYGARPVEFFVPSYNNPIMPDSYQAWRIKQQHNSNPTESTLFIGYTVTILGLVAILALFSQKVRKLKLKKNISYPGLVLISTGTALTLFLFSLPYYYAFSRVLIKLTDTWRVLSRIFLAIDPLVIILAALGIFILSRKWPRYIYIGFVVLCTGLLFIEYLMVPLRLNGDLYKDSPKVYHLLANDKSVEVIAEYPLVALDSGPSTFTFAQVHGKKMINANDSSLSRDPFHSAVAGLRDKQTLGVLKDLGVDIVTIYNLGNLAISELVDYPPTKAKGVVKAYKISDNVPGRSLALIPSDGFFDLSVDDNQISHRVLREEGTMTVQKINGGQGLSVSQKIAFGAQSIGPATTYLTMYQDNREIWSGEVTQTNVEARVDLSQPISLVSTGPIDITNMEAF